MHELSSLSRKAVQDATGTKSFGFSIFDIASFVQLSWQVVEGAKAACGEHDDLTKEMVTLHTVLSHVETEMQNPDSMLGNKRDKRVKGLRNHIQGCEEHLLRLDRLLSKYNSLSKSEKSVQRLWQKAKFGNREIVSVKDIRQKVRTYTDAIAITLQLFSSGSQSRVERQLNRQSGSLDGIQESVNLVLARLTAVGVPDGGGSVMTDYHGDDRTFWRDLRRELIGEGFSSKVLRGKERLIRDYVVELGQRGVLDDRNASTTTLPLIRELKVPWDSERDENDDEGVQKKRVNPIGGNISEKVVDEKKNRGPGYLITEKDAPSSDSASDSSLTTRNRDDESILQKGQGLTEEETIEDTSSDCDSETSSSSRDNEDENIQEEDQRAFREEDNEELPDSESESSFPNTSGNIQQCVTGDETDDTELYDDIAEEDNDSSTEDDVTDSESEPEHFPFCATVVREFLRKERAISQEAKLNQHSADTPCSRVHPASFQASCEEVLDFEFMLDSHPNVVPYDFPHLCPRSESPLPKPPIREQKQLVTEPAKPVVTPRAELSESRWVFYSHPSLFEPKARVHVYNFWEQEDLQEFQSRYDEYTTRIRESIESDTLINIIRKAPSSSEKTFARETSFWGDIEEKYDTEGLSKLLYRRGFESEFYAQVCETSILEVGLQPEIEDLRRYQIPEGYFFSRWDARREPVCLHGNVFDVSSLGSHLHLWSAYIWGNDSKQAKTAYAFKVEMTTFETRFCKIVECLRVVFEKGDVYPGRKVGVVKRGNKIWLQLKWLMHSLNDIRIRTGCYKDESLDCCFARIFEDNVRGVEWVELREDMDKFCVVVESHLENEIGEMDMESDEDDDSCLEVDRTAG
ncbi:hypothetical protein HYFRA_00003960 [Hymenoscyphus fraxineus]|uniref:Fungal N-terminal domain-containing protein n=1 Tax=Hymenoscyphus fraxineus TaxID=746836 RepID=A0A9N9PR70_9HELO|nr:hypothetical protein HYFRA_00003960 [Hymenoscyphus fraxineus]